MQLSRFVIVYKHLGEDEHVLYSVLTDRYVGIDTSTLEAIERWQAGFPPQNENEAATAELLFESGFLIRSREEEDQALRSHLDRVSEGIPETMYVPLMPTLACNLAFTYCFQKDSPAFNRMSSGVESSTVQWILDRTAASGCRKLIVHYFGGEPLTRKDYVLRTAQAFHDTMRACGGEFSWEVISNGVHLDLPFVKALTALGDGFIKITLDGDRETHDQARVYRDGRGSFVRSVAQVPALGAVRGWCVHARLHGRLPRRTVPEDRPLRPATLPETGV